MAAIGEHSLQWFSAERAVAGPDLPSLVATLVHEHSALLYRIVLSVVRNSSEAEDIVQEVFLRVLQRQEQLGSIVLVRPWLVRIAWNLALDRKRRIRPEQMDDMFAAGLVSRDLPADDLLEETRKTAQVLAAIDRLPKAERQALLLTAMEELSTAEIAAALDRSESSIRSLLFRARARLRQRLGEQV